MDFYTLPPSRDDAPAEASWRALLRTLLPPTLLSLLCIAGASVSYLLFHTLAEVFSIVIAMTALVVATTSHAFTRNLFVVFIAVTIGWCASIDLIHTLAYKGMGLLPVDSANPATQLWIAARLLQAVALCLAPWCLRHTLRITHVHTAFALLVSLALLGIWSGHFPDAYHDDTGLTPFKIYTEYLIILILAAALVRIWQERSLMTPALLHSLSAAVLVMMLSEFLFTRYVSVYANANLMGHILKIYAYWFVYVALVHNTLREPFSMLARAASSYDAVPDPTLIVDRHDRILQANEAAARHAGQPAASLVGQLSHPLFHNPQLSREQCPACQTVLSASRARTVELNLGEAGAVEISLAPFTGPTMPQRTYVQVIRDISERQKLARERERLVYDLGERVKELGCLYAISNAADKAEQDHGALLARVTQLLPDGLRYPEQARAAIDSDWGRFGDPETLHDPERLTREIRVNGQQVGSITLSYRQGFQPPGDPFLLEEVELLDTVAQRVGETLARQLATARNQRLTYLYEMLSATNRAIVHCRDADSLLDALFEALLTHSTFTMLFLAWRDAAATPFRLRQSRGIPALHQAELERVFSEPLSAFSQAAERLRQGQVVRLEVPHEQASDAWITHLQNRHIRERALMPLRRDGEILGVVGLYSDANGSFAADEMRLLEEMASDMSFALDTLVSESRRQAAERDAHLSEHRFQEVFASSPLPMQIHDLQNHRIRALNRAHQQWLGYTLEDLPDDQAWLQQAYSSPDVRAQISQLWAKCIDAAQQSNAPISSPELELRCKDGSIRVARGTMTLVGNDAILAWTDLTDARRDEARIRRYIAQLEGSMKSTLQVVSNMVEMRDPYTAGHERRVGLIAAAIARELGWTPAQCETMELVGLVHDIGKMAIPAEILSKPARLSAIEMELVRGHAQAGYEILKDVEFTAPVAQIIHQHHERMDGSGYPNHLSGAEIMMEARILAVADVLESMAAHRPYRPALGLEVALAELEQGKGRLYDPQVVDALLNLIREQGYQLPQ